MFSLCKSRNESIVISKNISDWVVWKNEWNVDGIMNLSNTKTCARLFWNQNKYTSNRLSEPRRKQWIWSAISPRFPVAMDKHSSYKKRTIYLWLPPNFILLQGWACSSNISTFLEHLAKSHFVCMRRPEPPATPCYAKNSAYSSLPTCSNMQCVQKISRCLHEIYFGSDGYIIYRWGVCGNFRFICEISYGILKEFFSC